MRNLSSKANAILDLAKTISSRLLSLACALPFAFALSQGSSCKEDNSNKPSANSSRTSVNSVEQQALKKKAASVPEGVWGGIHIHMQVTDQGADIEYDCAHGKISGPLRLDSRGRFRTSGIHVMEHAGPIRMEETLAEQPASYMGNVGGKTMTLEVTLTANSEHVGTFTLTQGSEGRIRKCG
ncbi:MAG: hypothetical protein ABI923_10155 [bacterium]